MIVYKGALNVMANVLELENLRKEFPRKRKRGQPAQPAFVAVDNISCSVQRGEIFGLLGPNGAGKTTTIKMISSLLRPTAGRISVAGVDAMQHPIQALRHLGTVLTGERSVYWKLTGRENLEYFAALHGIPRKLAQVRIDALLDRFQLSKRADENVEKYSTGMRQRICLAKAMLSEPELLILDEPTAGLDPQSARNLRELILEIKEEGRTVLLTTHYMEEADQLCDRVAIIDHGRIIAMDTPQELKHLLDDRRLFSIETERWQEQWTDTLLERGVSNLQTSLNEELRRFATTLHLNGGMGAGEVLTYLVTVGAGVTNFSNREPSLEDVFIHLTGKSLRE
jgi:ABC-2 type transport system ATP-binding protein